MAIGVLRVHLRDAFDGDVFGCAQMARFDMAAVLHMLDRTDLLEGLGYRPGLGTAAGIVESDGEWELLDLHERGHITPEDMAYGLRVLDRFVEMYRDRIEY
jgi:hypothetical protein